MPNGYSEALRVKMLRETEAFLGQRLRIRRRMAEEPNGILRVHHKNRKTSDSAPGCAGHPFAALGAAAC
jgi:hypothetical protein